MNSEKKYPIMQIARERLKVMDKNLSWLSLQTGRTERWFIGNPEIGKIDLEVLIKMSKALQFDFIVDYYKFLGKNTLPEINTLMDQTQEYILKPEKKISVQMTLTANVSQFQKNFAKLLQVIQDEGNKYGFQIQ